jgi:hypothetical protein
LSVMPRGAPTVRVRVQSGRTGFCFCSRYSGHGADEQFSNGRADSSFAAGLACLRWHDDGAGAGVTIVGERSLTGAVTSHSSVKQERPCSIGAGNGRRVGLSRPGILRVGPGRGQGQHERDC